MNPTINRIPFYKHAMGLVHHNDPANDIDDDPAVKLRNEIAARPEFNPATRDNFLEAVELLEPELIGMLVEAYFAMHPHDPLACQVREYWDTQIELQAVSEEAKRIVQ